MVERCMDNSTSLNRLTAIVVDRLANFGDINEKPPRSEVHRMKLAIDYPVAVGRGSHFRGRSLHLIRLVTATLSL